MMQFIHKPFLALSLALVPHAVWADDLAETVGQELVDSQTPGVAVVAVQDGKLVRAQAFGLANLEHSVPVHSDTLFKMGATGMQITAAAVMLLVEDGKLQLDVPVTQYLSGAPDKWSKVTIRQLLDHTSGLPATPNGDFRTEYTNAELLAIIAAEDLNFPAGTRWRFSYADYIVLGFVIGEVTGKPWVEFVKERVFTPLGMLSARGIDESAIIPNRAAGYEIRDGALRNAEWISATANSTADGSIYLSALDYAAWAQAISQRELLRPASWNELARPAKLNDGSICAYAPGWFHEANQKAWWHSGSWQGFQTYVMRYPSEDLTVAVFANGEQADVQHLARDLAALTDPALARSPASPRADANKGETAKARKLIEQIGAGEASHADFADFADLDFNELTAWYGAMIGDLGSLQDIALFDKRATCGETAYRYRARYSDGMIEIRLGMTDNGKVSNLEIVPLRAWDEPL